MCLTVTFNAPKIKNWTNLFGWEPVSQLCIRPVEMCVKKQHARSSRFEAQLHRRERLPENNG